MDSFNPFDKDIRDLSADDLNVLFEVSEGWYVEYKGELPRSEGVSKAVSAFANTYGGWLFIGIKEKSKCDSTAGEICGIPVDGLEAALNRVRQSVSAGINPVPDFDVQVIHGKAGAVLAEGRVVICIRVDLGKFPPYLHSRGVIYRRVSDGSEGRAEIDRHELDLLYERRKESEEKYNRWFDREDSEEVMGDVPHLRIMLDTNRHRRREERYSFSTLEMKAALESGGITINSIYTTGLGWVARQTETARTIDGAAFTWIIRGGWREVWWPLSVHVADDISGIESGLLNRPGATEFIKQLGRQSINEFRIVDLSSAFGMLMAIVKSNNELDALMELNDSMHVRVDLVNVKGLMPFYGLDRILDMQKVTGVPVQLVSKCSIPGVKGAGGMLPSRFKEIVPNGDEPPDGGRILAYAAFLYDLISSGFGLSLSDAISGPQEGLIERFLELMGHEKRPDC